MKQIPVLLLALLLGVALLAAQGCNNQRSMGRMPHHSGQGASGLPTTGDGATGGEPDISYTLRTELSGGGFIFRGVGEGIEGRANPVLEAEAGELVEIILVNGDGIIHDLAIPELNVATARISQRGSESSLRFIADAPGQLAYYCTVPGHRQAGMEGRVVIRE